MADRYWVGGTGTWDSTSTANWSTASGGSSGASVPTAADNVFFDAGSDSGGIFTVTLANSPRVCNDITISGLDFTMTLAGTSIGLTVSGSLSFPATNFTRTYTGTTTFNATTTGKTVTTNGVAFDGPVTFNGVGGAWTLNSALTTGTSRTTTLTNGTIDLNNLTLTTGFFSSSNSNTRTIAFGTGNITCTGSGGTLWTTSTVTNLTTTGTQVVNISYSGNTATSVLPGALSESNSISFNFTAGSYTLTFLGTNGHTARSVDFTGFIGAWNNTGDVTVYGNLTLASFTPTLSTGTMTFGATSGTQLITPNGRSLSCPIAFNGVGSTFRLQGAFTLTVSRAVTLTNGSLDLNNFTLTAGSFVSDNSNTRSIAFGTTGSIVVNSTTAGTTVLSMATATNFTFTGTSIISAVMSTTRTFNFGGTAGATTSNRLNINLTSGASVPTFTGSFRQINFTGSTCNPGAVNISCHGFTLASGGTYTSTDFTTVGDGTLTYTGKSISILDINTAGITTTLADVGQNVTTTLTNGTLNLAGFTLTSTTSVTTAAGTKNLTFNGGTLVCSGATATSFNNSNPTGFTTTAGTGTGKISMTAATAKTFVGGGSTYNCTLEQAGAGALTITGSNTFTTISNSVQPTTITFTAGTTTTVTNWSVNGTAGNLVTIGSDTTAQHTLSKASGVVSSDYLSISYSNAVGGAVWNAGANSINGGNNTGWIFTAGLFFLMFS